ncbi:DUF4302 domain-containing protein [Ancylomarina sp. 16SWW S1-10-2]|uniref:DUF4302 domain-containing protein n=1 Tax=Ancylomarina sp. 16SWW S1-10-2 TaxID=2499681 RepID=UPI0012AD5A1D|nr:DUF4302 domain-containing protein [Ancylomarina sp. 16SWW S1-10-2]MRT93246.1 DUF4302 domain-containing protein [Ancylomarina sp. 16SWW S1-10-2]
MKNTILIILACLLAFTACDNEVDELFEQSSQERINDAKIEYKDILTSSENGWVIEVIPGAENKGAYSAYVTFNDDGKVYLSTDFSPYDYEAEIDSSLYEINYTQGMTIAFTTFSQMNYFSNPNNSGGTGLGGDVELLVKEISDDKIVCEGKVNKGSFIFTKADTKSHIDALNEVLKVEEALIGKTYFSDYAFPVLQFEDGTKVSFIYDSYYRAVSTTEYKNTADGVEINKSILRVKFDKTGMSFIDSLEVDGNVVSRLDYNATDNSFKTPSDQSTAEFIISPLPPAEIAGVADAFINSKYGTISSYGKNFKAIMDPFSELYPLFAEIQFSRYYSYSGITFKFKPNDYPYAKLKDNEITKMSESEIKFEFDTYVDKYSNMFKYHIEDRLTTPEGQAIMDVLFSDSGFSLFSEDNVNFTLVKKDDPTIWFMMYMSESGL